MKTNAIIRIILFSIAFLLLLGILLTGLGYNGYLSSRFIGRRWEITDSSSSTVMDAKDQPLNEFHTASAQLREMEIQWVVGTITIQSGDVDQLTYQETPVSDSRYKLVAKESSGELNIQYCAEWSGLKFPMFGADLNIEDVTKDLTITIPRDMVLESIEIEAASTEVILRDVNVREVSLNTASGKCDLENCSIGELDVDTASGDVHFSGVLDSLDFDAASARFTGVFTNTPRSINVDSMSGDIEITLPADAGFAVSMDALSGDFACDFDTTIRNGAYVCGNGSCQIEYDGMSGELTIRKGP